MSRKQDISALRCPVTLSPLQYASAAMLAGINRAIALGEVQTRESQTVSEPLEDALVNSDETLLFPLRGGVICLLAAEAVEIAEHWPPTADG
jgi:uncharacterized protein YbaR (Trm112 family)